MSIKRWALKHWNIKNLFATCRQTAFSTKQLFDDIYFLRRSSFLVKNYTKIAFKMAFVNEVQEENNLFTKWSLVFWCISSNTILETVNVIKVTIFKSFLCPS